MKIFVPNSPRSLNQVRSPAFYPCIPSTLHSCFVTFKEKPYDVAKRQTQQFQKLSNKRRRNATERIKREIRRGIITDSLSILSQERLPTEAETLLAEIVDLAYHWNNAVRSLPVDHLYRPFMPKVGTLTDQSLDPYFKHNGDLKNARVVAVVSLGLEISDLTARPGSVRFVVPKDKKAKACVLLDMPPEVLVSSFRLRSAIDTFPSPFHFPFSFTSNHLLSLRLLWILSAA